MAPRATPARLIEPGAMLASTHELDDGSRVRLRLLRPTDLEKIESFLEHHDGATDSHHFAFYDPRERLALAATRPAGGHEQIVGLADVALSDTDIDVLVADDFRRRGLRGLLTRAAASLAARRRRAA